MKAYICSNSENGRENIDGLYYLILETGECPYSHWCSNMGYAAGDLYFNRPNRIEEMTKRYGEIEIVYLGDDSMTFNELIERNHTFKEEQDEN